MKFSVHAQEPEGYKPDTAYLIKGSFRHGRYDDSWNDYSYRTTYTLKYCAMPPHVIDLGCVKIGEFGMGEGRYTPELPTEFDKLDPNRFFSVSDSESYYDKLSNIENGRGYDILMNLNDFALCRDVYEKAKDESVTGSSLLRYINGKHETYLDRIFRILEPPINLNTMRRVFGSTGWPAVDKGLIEMQRLLFSARTRYYYNAIATIGREILKEIAGEIYDDELHRKKDVYTTAPNEDQYINKMCGFIDFAQNNGEISEKTKKYMEHTVKLVQEYVHRDDLESYECFLCVHAVIALVFQISILRNKSKYSEVTE